MRRQSEHRGSDRPGDQDHSGGARGTTGLTRRTANDLGKKPEGLAEAIRLAFQHRLYDCAATAVQIGPRPGADPDEVTAAGAFVQTLWRSRGVAGFVGLDAIAEGVASDVRHYLRQTIGGLAKNPRRTATPVERRRVDPLQSRAIRLLHLLDGQVNKEVADGARASVLAHDNSAIRLAASHNASFQSVLAVRDVSQAAWRASARYARKARPLHPASLTQADSTF